MSMRSFCLRGCCLCFYFNYAHAFLDYQAVVPMLPLLVWFGFLNHLLYKLKQYLYMGGLDLQVYHRYPKCNILDDEGDKC